MQLDNVKARATSLTRSTIFNINNKLFPVLEYFTCTDEESEYYDKYVALKSYKIGVVSTPRKFITNVNNKFIQGSIIEFNSSESQDYHLVDTINKYFDIGFRIINEI